MDVPGNSYPLNDDTYRQITDLIYASSGLRFDESMKFMIHRRLSARVDELQLDSFERYYFYLRYHRNREAELDAIFDLIATHETYFFREESQLTVFSNDILPELMEKRNQFRTLRIWCAGCSSGEEPYTVAILCSQHPELKEWDLNILATDISQKMIDNSMRGIYTETSFRSTSESVKSMYFDEVEARQYRIREEIKQLVTFLKLNLMDENRATTLSEMDLIFCRNVMMYLDVEAKKKIVEIFYSKLRAGGYLLLGQSESLLTLSTEFKLRHLKNEMVYQK